MGNFTDAVNSERVSKHSLFQNRYIFTGICCQGAKGRTKGSIWGPIPLPEQPTQPNGVSCRSRQGASRDKESDCLSHPPSLAHRKERAKGEATHSTVWQTSSHAAPGEQMEAIRAPWPQVRREGSGVTEVEAGMPVIPGWHFSTDCAKWWSRASEKHIAKRFHIVHLAPFHRRRCLGKHDTAASI